MIPAKPIGKPVPKQQVQDNPQARRILYLKAQGLSNNEIAKLEGISYQWVSIVIRQPWFQEELARILNVTGIEAVRKKAMAYGVTAMDTAFELMHDAASETVKAQCSFQLMKIGIGETQNIRTQEVHDLDPTQLAEEIARKEAELANIQGLPKETKS